MFPLTPYAYILFKRVLWLTWSNAFDISRYSAVTGELLSMYNILLLSKKEASSITINFNKFSIVKNIFKYYLNVTIKVYF